jgi:hypothetical protein
VTGGVTPRGVRHFWQRFPGEALFDEARQQFCEGPDIFADAFQIRSGIARQSRRLWEALDDGFAHLLPQQPDAVHIRRCVAGGKRDGQPAGDGRVPAFEQPGKQSGRIAECRHRRAHIRGVMREEAWTTDARPVVAAAGSAAAQPTKFKP